MWLDRPKVGGLAKFFGINNVLMVSWVLMLLVVEDSCSWCGSVLVVGVCC